MTKVDYETVLARARSLSPEEQQRLREELAVMLDGQAELPDGREPVETVAETLEKIDENPGIEGT